MSRLWRDMTSRPATCPGQGARIEASPHRPALLSGAIHVAFELPHRVGCTAFKHCWAASWIVWAVSHRQICGGGLSAGGSCVHATATPGYLQLD